MSENEKQAKILPFHAINQFMTDSFRASVLRTVMVNLSSIPNDAQRIIQRAIRTKVKIPGYRKSTRAPAPIQAKGLEDVFKESARLVAAVLSGWSEINLELGKKVYDFLIEEEWEILPLAADRKKLPGFITTWPDVRDFDAMFEAFNNRYPAIEPPINEVILLMVWISTRLPVDKPEA